MTTMLRADALQPRMQIMLTCANGRTLATVQGFELASERDLVHPDQARLVPDNPVIGLHLQLSRAVMVPAMPRWRAALITLWAAPGDLFERYV